MRLHAILHKLFSHFLLYFVFINLAAICLGAPAIQCVPSNLTFTGQVFSAIESQTIAITNTGDATLNYIITSDSFWLSASNARNYHW